MAFDAEALRAKLAALTPAVASIQAVSGWCQFYRTVRAEKEGGRRRMAAARTSAAATAHPTHPL
jgi:hypothetical protein